MSDTVYNTEMISATTLVALVKEIPISKAGKHIKLLIPDDLLQYRTFLEEKIKINDKILAQYSPSSPTPVAIDVNLNSLKEENLIIFDLMHKIDSVFSKLQRAEEKAANKGKGGSSRVRKLLME